MAESAAESGRIRVVYVDSNDDARTTIPDHLERANGVLEVDTAETIDGTLDRVETGGADCVVTADRLGDGDSLDMIEAMADRRPDLPVVVFPAEGSEQLAGAAIAAGAAGYRPRDGLAESCQQVAADVVAAVRERTDAAAVLNRMTDAFFAVDDSWRFTYLNERGRQVVSEAIGEDLSIEELRGRQFLEEIPEVEGTTFYEKYTEAMETQTQVTFEEYYEPLDTWFEVHAYPSQSGLSVYFTDVSDRKEYEQELEHRESVLTDMYRIVADADRTFEAKLDRLFTIGREELGTEYATLSWVDGDDYVFEHVQTPDGDDAIASGDRVPLEWTSCERIVSTEQRLVVGDVSSQPPEIADRQGNEELGIECYLGTPVISNGEVTGTFCFYGSEPRDGSFSQWEITLVDLMGSWVSYERERERRERQLTRERNRLEEFASVVSHDLRNPLNVATANLELARDEHDDENLATVADALDRMERLIEDILALARLGQQVVEEEPASFPDLVRTAWASVSEPASQLVVEGDASMIVGDEDRLVQLFENLFRNSIEHGSTNSGSQARRDAVEHGSTDPDSQAHQDAGRTSSAEPSVADAPEDGVTVRVGPLGNGRGFYVADDGPGIPPEKRDDIFDHGFTTREDGTGFGLSIVEEIVDAHGGTVTVTDSEDGGARFEISGIGMR